MSGDNYTIRLDDPFMKRIDGYAKAKSFNRAEAIRHLIDLGLRLNDLQDNKSADCDREIQMMIIEIWLMVAQVKELNKGQLNATKMDALSDNFRGLIQSRYQDIFAKYPGFVKTGNTNKD